MCCLLDVCCLISKQDLKTNVVLADNMTWPVCCCSSNFHCLCLSYSHVFVCDLCFVFESTGRGSFNKKLSIQEYFSGLVLR